MLERASLVGLGELGAYLAACLAHKGFKVIGVDASTCAFLTRSIKPSLASWERELKYD